MPTITPVLLPSEEVIYPVTLGLGPPKFNGSSIVTMPDYPSAKSIEFSRKDIVGMSISVFTGQQQIQDWNSSSLEADIVMPPLIGVPAQNWVSFLNSCQGVKNVFQFGAAFAGLNPSGTVPNGYWRLAENITKWSITPGWFYGMQFKIMEAK